MGIQEKNIAKVQKRIRNKEIILKSIATAGVLSVAILAPNVLQAFAKMGIIGGKRQKEVIMRAKDRLIAKNLIQRDVNGFLTLTAKGQKELNKITLCDPSIRKAKKWDKKWRVLIFDIPEKHKEKRNNVRRLLGDIGFIKLQNSVWVYPHDCEDFVALLKTDLNLGRNLLYLIVDSIEDDALIRKYFELE